MAGGFAAMRVYGDKRAVTLLLLGFFAGLPPALIFSSLSLWLSEAGIARSEITLFSLAALGYSFKFVWAPLVDGLPLPWLTRRLGRRCAWLCAAQAGVVAALLLMAMIDPSRAGMPGLMAAAAVFLGFASASQDIVIDAYRIEIVKDDLAMQPVLSATYVAGYRVGMVVSGAGVLFLADFFGSTKAHYVYGAWQTSYFLMAAVMAAGILLTFAIAEPRADIAVRRSVRDNLRLLLLFAATVAAFVGGMVLTRGLAAEGALAAFALQVLRFAGAAALAALVAWALVKSRRVPSALVRETWVAPLADFFQRYGKAALLLLALIGFYRVSDVVAGVVSNLFYEHLGFSKTDIGKAVKTFGVIAALIGGFAGGLVAQRFSLMRMMMLGALLAAGTNLLFSLLEWTGAYRFTFADVPVMLYAVVGFDNLAAGFAGTVFVAFLSALTSIRFTAVQYAIFSSLMTLFPKLLGAYSGAMVDALGGYPAFFALTAALGLPILALVWLNDKIIFRPQRDKA